MKTIRLTHSLEMPLFGLGTWKSNPGEVGRAVQTAIELGYRHIDCAAIYGNEAEIGEAISRCIRERIVSRDELWITSKLWNDSHAATDVGPALRQTLKDLQLEYLDLYLIHWPVALKKGAGAPVTAENFISLTDLPLEETWGGMEQQVEAGLARAIGVSNFSASKLALLEKCGRIPVANNQIELHPYLQQNELLHYARLKGISITAYSPLGSADRPERLRKENDPVLLDDETITQIAQSHSATPAQVLIAWALTRNTAVIPKSVKPERLLENFKAQELELSQAECQALAALDKSRRYVDGSFWAPPGSPYSVESLWG